MLKVKFIRVFRCAFVIVLWLACLPPTVRAAIIATGGVEPNPLNEGTVYVGKATNGSLVVDGGSYLSSRSGYIGHDSSIKGVVTVDGQGSRWDTYRNLYVGDSGNGELSIVNKGFVFVKNGELSIGESTGSTGVVSVDGDFSVLHCGTVLRVGNYGHGTLKVTGGGIVNSNGGAGKSYIGCVPNSEGLVMVEGIGSYAHLGAALYVGDYGNPVGHATLDITDGGSVGVGHCYINSGIVKVEGSGSICDSGGVIKVGNAGQLNISRGGTVESTLSSSVRGDSYSTGVATVDGVDSTWTASKMLGVTGILNITGGGRVAVVNNVANSVEIFGSQSLLVIDTGNGSHLHIDGDNGTMNNEGNVRIVAGAKPISNTVHTPISANFWSGSGTYQALGGRWNEEHTFIASPVATGISGEEVSIILNDKQRVLFSDTGTGKTNWSMGASFAATASPENLAISATVASGKILETLDVQIDSRQSVLSGWTFTTNSGYSSGDPAYLSFKVGAGFSVDNFSLWQYDILSGWSVFRTNDLTYDGKYVNFTVTSLSSYAVTAVPEPGTLTILIIGLLSLFGYVWR